jgi:hypothetical protein
MALTVSVFLVIIIFVFIARGMQQEIKRPSGLLVAAWRDKF